MECNPIPHRPPPAMLHPPPVCKSRGGWWVEWNPIPRRPPPLLSTLHPTRERSFTMMSDDDSGAADALPPHAFVPGGPWPHPEGLMRGPSAPIEGEGSGWSRSPAYRRGIALFNAGYYWEAHEVWEGLWHAHGRRGPTADLIKGLIKLAAAGVKVRQRQRHGVVTHARLRGGLDGPGTRTRGAIPARPRPRRMDRDGPTDRRRAPRRSRAAGGARLEGVRVPDRAALSDDRSIDQAVAEGVREARRRRQAAEPANARTASTTAPTTPCEPPSTKP